MPYSKSKARVDFENNLKLLLKNSRDASFKNANISYNHRIMIFQSSIFLLSASFEGYLKNLIEDLIYSFTINSALLKDLPPNFRSLVLLDSQLNAFKGYINVGDEAKILSKLDTHSLHYSILNDNEIFTNQIKAGLIIGTKKYPSIKNLNILFNRIGVKKIINELNRIGKKDYGLDLKSFLDIRESLAHENAPSITFVDIKRHYKNISEIIGLLDRITYAQIVGHSNVKYWVN
jgi:hypothetical protein